MSDTINDINKLDPNAIYTYADYLSWRFNEMVELIKGKMVRMSAPVEYHQRISSNLHYLLYSFLLTKSCRVYSAPFDVRLKDGQKVAINNENILTTVQPDLCIICDLSKIDTKGCFDADLPRQHQIRKWNRATAILIFRQRGLKNNGCRVSRAFQQLNTVFPKPAPANFSTRNSRSGFGVMNQQRL